MKLLEVKRFEFSPDWTIGKLYINDFLDGYTVEDEIREVKVHGETAVDYGEYDLKLRQSPKFSESFLWSETLQKLIDIKSSTFGVDKTKANDWRPHDLIWVYGTPRHTYVLIHWGNTDDNTDGCLIVGRGTGIINGQKGVVDSRNYYKSLYERIYPIIKKGGYKIVYSKELPIV